MARTALRVAFGLIWVADAAFTWTSSFAVHYVGYLHNAAHGQPGWLAWWFDAWIALVTPHAGLFIWGTRIVETLLAAALLLGFARKTVYVTGAIFSLLIWSTAEGFGGPYTVGATNMGAGIVYVIVFIALAIADAGPGLDPYSLDEYVERRSPGWRRVSEWRAAEPTAAAHPAAWRVQGAALVGIAVLVFFLIVSPHRSMSVSGASPAPTAASPAATAPETTPAPATASAAPATAAASGAYTFDPARGATLYANTCIACHQITGKGVTATFPPLTGNAAVLDPDPTKHIEVVLNGLSGEVIGGIPYPTVMPPFGPALDDTAVADIINHERTSWGNQGKLVTADQVRAVRATTGGK
jgi:mono/diheme cytochrome c family protein/uncharacterized membrane protein YphA (DoxX/SURF4 family)